jgi:hypothetical protein
MPSTIEKSIDVHCDVTTAYNQWTQFEDFPEFMNNVDDVRQVDDVTLRWKGDIAGVEREWTARIIEQKPDDRIAWRAEGEVHHAGIVTFDPVDTDMTRVTLHLEYEPEDWKEKAADAMNLVQRRVAGEHEGVDRHGGAAAGGDLAEGLAQNGRIETRGVLVDPAIVERDRRRLAVGDHDDLAHLLLLPEEDAPGELEPFRRVRVVRPHLCPGKLPEGDLLGTVPEGHHAQGVARGRRQDDICTRHEPAVSLRHHHDPKRRVLLCRRWSRAEGYQEKDQTGPGQA